jgi:hypothetical protein
VITVLGTSTTADFNAIGVPTNITPAVGVSFLATSTGAGLGNGQVQALSGSNLLVNGVALTPGVRYVITAMGTTPLVDFVALGVPVGVSPFIGFSFLALVSGSAASTGLVEAPAAGGALIDHIEVIGDPNLANNQGPHIIGSSMPQGMQFILACYFQGVLTAPADNTVIGLNFYMNNSAQGV